jgi:hypothetical protein
MLNDGPEYQFPAGFEPTCDGGGEVYDANSTLLSIAFLPAVPRFFRQRVLLIRTGEAQPDLFGVEDEDAVIAERDLSGVPTGFVADVYVLAVEADRTVRYPLFDGMPGWLDERNRGTDTLCRFDTAGVNSDFLRSQAWQSLRHGEHQNQG